MNDKEQIENVVQLYIDCMDESNPDKVKKVFHENAKVVGCCNIWLVLNRLYLQGYSSNNAPYRTMLDLII